LLADYFLFGFLNQLKKFAKTLKKAHFLPIFASFSKNPYKSTYFP